MDNAQHGMRLNFDIRSAQPQRRVAMRLAVLGDFSASSGIRQPDNAPVYVSKDNVNEILEGYGATLYLEVENFIHGVHAPLNVAIRVTDLSDLSPAGVVAHVPDLTAIYLFKERVQMLLRHEISAADFMSNLSVYDSCAALIPTLRHCRAAFANRPMPPARRETAPDNADIERIFDLVATPGQPTAPTTQGIEAVLHSIGTQRTASSAPPELAQVLDALTTMLDRQITAVLQHPQFQRMEATWRGVKLLLEHAGRQDVKIELIDTPREELAEVFHARVYNAEFSAVNATPLGLVLLDFEFDSSSRDVAVVHAIAQDAQALQTPVVFTARADFFGRVPDAAHPLPYLGTLLAESRYSAWNALRAKDCARWLCAAYNPLLLRARYTRENTQGLDYTEAVPERDKYLWGNPGWALAVLVARSMTNAHWPTQITGMQHGQITGLEVLADRDRSGNEIAIPLRTLLSLENTEDLAQFGFAALSCQPNRDAAYLLNAPTLRSGQELTSLPYQLLASRVTALLGAHRDLLLDGGDPEHITANAQKIIDSMFADTGPGAHTHIDVHPDQDRAGHHLLDLELHTGRDILNGATLHLTVPV
ncbi:MAG: type VI secretion system contractile sheath large subunit [Gammaproteobacteria bacterium]|nr:type VI secretion system contractile sheath large subunit [Gammaproteobacteria bacterium]